MDYPDFRLDGQVALVTGASKGIGFGLSKALAQAGADLAIAARSQPQLEVLAMEIRGMETTRRIMPLKGKQSGCAKVSPIPKYTTRGPSFRKWCERIKECCVFCIRNDSLRLRKKNEPSLPRKIRYVGWPFNAGCARWKTSLFGFYDIGRFRPKATFLEFLTILNRLKGMTCVTIISFGWWCVPNVFLPQMI